MAPLSANRRPKCANASHPATAFTPTAAVAARSCIAHDFLAERWLTTATRSRDCCKGSSREGRRGTRSDEHSEAREVSKRARALGGAVKASKATAMRRSVCGLMGAQRERPKLRTLLAPDFGRRPRSTPPIDLQPKLPERTPGVPSRAAQANPERRAFSTTQGVTRKRTMARSTACGGRVESRR